MDGIKMDNNREIYAYQRTEIQKIKQENEQRQELEKLLGTVDTFINRDYLNFFSGAEIYEENEKLIQNLTKISILSFEKIVFDDKEDINEKLSGVYNTMYNLGVSVSILIEGHEDGADFYLTTRSENLMSRAGTILEASLK